MTSHLGIDLLLDPFDVAAPRHGEQRVLLLVGDCQSGAHVVLLGWVVEGKELVRLCGWSCTKDRGGEHSLCTDGGLVGRGNACMGHARRTCESMMYSDSWDVVGWARRKHAW